MASPTAKKILYQLWETSCNYGESYWRFIGWMAFIILAFTVIYLPSSIGSITFKEYPYYEGNNFLTSLYFSVVTFATLGFGDITPVSDAGKLWVIFEVMCGYVMFGILITLVARKMTRS
jgi:voltage-gated potassium channel Kch